ncbi:MAG: hypothetical protein ACF8XB_17360 [Planctomycetota bacterium JB042]
MKPAARHRLLLIAPLVVAPIVACSDAENDAPSARRPAPGAAPRTASMAAVFEGTPDRAATSADPAPIDAGFGLTKLPASTVLAIRLPSVGTHGEAWERLAVTKAFEGVGGIAGLLSEPLANLRDEVSDEMPGGDAFLEALGAVEGEAVFGVIDVWPELAMARDGGLPFAMAAFVEVGDGEASLRTFLDSMLEQERDPHGPTFERVGEDGFRADTRKVRFEMRLVDGRLCAWMGPRAKSSGAIDRLLAQDGASSFAGTALVADGPSVADGETRWLEAYLSLTPVWEMASRMAPAEAREMIDALHLPSLEGVSFVSSLAGDSFHDRALLRTDGEDILSAFLEQPALDPDWARYVFAGADSGGVTSFSPAKTIGRLRRGLPGEGRRAIAEAISGFQQMTGLDLVDDIFGRLGPHFVHGSRGDLASAMLDATDFEAFVAIEVREADELQAIIDKAFQSGMLPVAPRPRQVGSVKYHSIALPLPEGPAGVEPSYGFVGDALVVASSGETFGKVVAAFESGGKAAPDWLREALAAATGNATAVTAGETGAKVRGLHAMVRTAQQESGEDWPYLPTAEQVDAFTADLPDEWTVARRGSTGFVFESRSPFGSTLVAAAPLAIVAAVAIPQLLTARLSSNEAAAMATLRSLHSAQEQFRASAVADRDGDGQGEFGTFGELTGAVALPDGALLEPPMMSSAFAYVRGGAVERSGYAYRLALPGRGGEPIGERDDGGAPDGIDVRMAEQVWLAYAYPLKPRSTGNRVFFIDQTGHILFTTNDAPGQAYDPDHPPSFDAAFAADDRPMAQGGHVGRDGGFWMLAN